MQRMKPGDPVRIVVREVVHADKRSRLYYPFYGGLEGRVFHIYGEGDKAEAAVDLDLSCLPGAVAQRHRDAEQAMLLSLPPAQRRAADRDTFHLRYVVLVRVSDLLRRRPARATGAVTVP